MDLQETVRYITRKALELIMDNFTIHSGISGILGNMTRTQPDTENRYNEIIAAALAKIPSDCIEWVIGKITFVRPEKMRLSYAICGDQLKHFEGIIVLFDELLEQSTEVQEFAILHEIAHIKLKHNWNADSECMHQQEVEADKLAKKWIECSENSQAEKNETS